MAERLVAQDDPGAQKTAGSVEAIGRLTPRQLRLLRLRAEGRTHEEIALELGRSHYTVKNNFTAVFAKLGIRGGADKAVRACYLLGRYDEARERP